MYMKTLFTIAVALMVNLFTVDSATAQSSKLEFFKVKKEACDLVIEFGANSLEPYTHFVVEKSHNGRSYTDVATIQPRFRDAAPSTPEYGAVMRYQYVDESPYAKNYYRIRVMKGRGDYFYSRPIRMGAPCIAIQDDIQLTPNVVGQKDNTTSISMEWPASNCIVEMLDMTGRTVKTWNLRNLDAANKVDLDVSGVNEGIYLMTVKNHPIKPVKLMIVNH